MIYPPGKDGSMMRTAAREGRSVVEEDGYDQAGRDHLLSGMGKTTHWNPWTVLALEALAINVYERASEPRQHSRDCLHNFTLSGRRWHLYSQKESIQCRI